MLATAGAGVENGAAGAPLPKIDPLEGLPNGDGLGAAAENGAAGVEPKGGFDAPAVP